MCRLQGGACLLRPGDRLRQAPGADWPWPASAAPDAPRCLLPCLQTFPGLVAALGPGLHRTAPGGPPRAPLSACLLILPAQQGPCYASTSPTHPLCCPRTPSPATGITEQLVDCSGGTEVSEETGFQRKAAALFAVLQEQRAPRTIVFCNKIESCERLAWLGRRQTEGDMIEMGRGACCCPACRCRSRVVTGPPTHRLPSLHLLPFTLYLLPFTHAARSLLLNRPQD